MRQNKADDSACGGYYRKSLTLFIGQSNVGKSSTFSIIKIV
jgi:GTP-binding protein EngB required for normal cell division